jgi:hypothetical protein
LVFPFDLTSVIRILGITPYSNHKLSDVQPSVPGKHPNVFKAGTTVDINIFLETYAKKSNNNEATYNKSHT